MFFYNYSEITPGTPPIMIAGYGTDQAIINDPRYSALKQLVYRGTQTPIENRKHWVHLFFKEINIDKIKTKKAWFMGFFNEQTIARISVPMTDKGDSGGALLQINEMSPSQPFYILGTVIGTRSVQKEGRVHYLNLFQTFNKREVQCIYGIINNLPVDNRC